MTSGRDREIMAEALRLGHTYKGRTTPNPAVGAVVVRGGVIVGRGAHERAGGPHAETRALAQAGRRAQGAILYVTLEPCAHHGRTPPCADAVAAAGVAAVVIGTLDPHPDVAGKGAARLAAAGIDVKVGVRERQCRHLAEDFASAVVRGRPWVTAKFAASLDGKLATRTGDSRWITGEAARIYAHRLRAEHAAVVVGKKTVIQDDPRLTVRSDGETASAGPVRLVVTAKGDIPAAAAFWNEPGPPVWIACGEDIPRREVNRFEKLGATVVVCRSEGGKVSLPSLLENLTARGITSIMVEGGGELLGSFFDAGLVDRVVSFIAPLIIGGKKAIPAVGGKGITPLQEAFRLREIKRRRFDSDICVDGYITDVNNLFACVAAPTREYKRRGCRRDR